jgi:TolB-like protein
MTANRKACLRQLNRILDSAAFRNVNRLRTFLRFVVEETLAGRQDEIKEYSVGVAVCGRPSNFNPKTDPIVRVDASRLRSRLKLYYETEGFQDEVRIELAKGNYVPIFRQIAFAQRVASGRIALAVLPFINFGADEQGFLADSLTEELIHSLVRLERLHVIARSSVFHLKGHCPDACEIGRRLRVDYVLEGSVRVTGGQLRITAQLVEVAKGWLVWSEKYECPWRSVFAVQDEIAASITDALKIQLIPSITPALFAHPTDDPDAYADYLRGRHYWNQRTSQSLTASLRYYEQALSRDPACAPAYAGIADTLMVMALNDQEPTSALAPRAREAARRSAQLRPESPEALVSLGCVKTIFDWDWEGGAQHLESAIQRQPGLARAHYLHGIVNLAPRGLWPQALAAMEVALRLDPVSPVLLRDLGLIHFLHRDYSRAETTWQQAEQIAPEFHGCLFWRARLAMELGQFEQAINILHTRQSNPPANTRVLASMAYAWARSGEKRRARTILSTLTTQRDCDCVPPLDFAVIWLGLEQWEQALCWLEKAVEERSAPLYQFAIDPIYDPIRQHPRAEQVRLRLNLPGVTHLAPSTDNLAITPV